MANNKSLSKGGLYYLLYNVLNLAFPFVNGIYVARVLLPESIGAVAAAQNFAQYFVILAFLGIPTYGLREIAKTRNDQVERNKVFSELYIINLISTILFLSIYVILILVIPTYRNELALYLITGISIALNAFNISWLYEGMEEFKFISLRNLAFKAIVFALLVLLVRDESDVLIYAFIAVIGIAGNYIVNMIYSPRYVKLTIKGLNLRRHMKSIMYLVAVNLAIELYSLMDVTMMNFMCSKDSIAFYKYGHQIEKMLLQVVNTFTIY
jgi:O-antigen/teichoic acid export membrane protein